MRKQALNLEAFGPNQTEPITEVPIIEVDLFDYWRITDSKGGAMIEREITKAVIRKIEIDNPTITDRTIETSMLAMQQCGLVWSTEQIEDAVENLGFHKDTPDERLEERKKIIDEIAKQAAVARETERATVLSERLNVEERASLATNTAAFSSAAADRSGDTLRYLETLAAKGLLPPERFRRAESVLRILYAWGNRLETPWEKPKTPFEETVR